MPPTRTAKASTSLKGQIRSKPRRHPGASSESTPGVQKIKSLLRQTRRLLAKDNLAANVRVEAERRLKSLQTDLTQAEAANKERTVAIKYHKVKFFERQKVLRKINQTKRRFEKSPTDSDAEARLFELRVDLNYILNYPKAKKYISLFPPEVRNAGAIASDRDSNKTAADREEVRNRIREGMNKGELDAEPELHILDIESSKTKGVDSKRKASDKSESKEVVPDIHDDGFFESDGE